MSDDEEPEVSALIVGYRSRGYLERCLSGALASFGEYRAEVLFIDCSDDGSEALVRERFPSVRTLPYQGNLGFARGNNVLARLARGRRLLLINPDTVFRDDESARLIRFADEHPDGGAWGTVTVKPNGSLDEGCRQAMLGPLALLLSMVGLSGVRPGALARGADAPKRVPVLSGAYLLVDRALWESLGGFDETFFMYAEEVDLSRRITDAGRALWIDPSIQLIHDVGSGVRRDPTRILKRARGNATFYRKHFGPITASLCCTGQWIHAAIRGIAGATLLRFIAPHQAREFREAFGAVMLRPGEWWSGWPRREARQ